MVSKAVPSRWRAQHCPERVRGSGAPSGSEAKLPLLGEGDRAAAATTTATASTSAPTAILATSSSSGAELTKDGCHATPQWPIIKVSRVVAGTHPGAEHGGHTAAEWHVVVVQSAEHRRQAAAERGIVLAAAIVIVPAKHLSHAGTERARVLLLAVANGGWSNTEAVSPPEQTSGGLRCDSGRGGGANDGSGSGSSSASATAHLLTPCCNGPGQRGGALVHLAGTPTARGS